MLLDLYTCMLTVGHDSKTKCVCVCVYVLKMRGLSPPILQSGGARTPSAPPILPWLGSYTMGGYKVLVYIVQATYTIAALLWFI